MLLQLDVCFAFVLYISLRVQFVSSATIESNSTVYMLFGTLICLFIIYYIPNKFLEIVISLGIKSHVVLSEIIPSWLVEVIRITFSTSK